MTPAETADLLATVVAYDGRTIGLVDVAAWHECVSDLDLDECRRAVVKHYTTETTWLMPAHLDRLVRKAKSSPHDSWWNA